MDSVIFYNWVQAFVKETTELRKVHNFLVLTLDGFAGHLSFQSLNLLKENNILVVALPAHTSHRMQVLDYTVFSPFKNSLTKRINERIILVGASAMRNDVYTLCELVHEAYKEAVTYKNIVAGFKACGIWCNILKTADPSVIKPSDITNVDGYGDRHQAFDNFLELVEQFKSSRQLFHSDGIVMDSGHLSTTSGALLTSPGVLKALQDRREQLARVAQEKADRAKAAEERRTAVANERAQRIAAAEKKKQEAEEYKNWLSESEPRWKRLNETRLARRLAARALSDVKKALNTNPNNIN